MYQKLILVGNLGGDPDMKYMPNGTAVTNFSVATSERWTDNEGQKQEKTVWFRVAVWGNQAEAVNKYLSKGSKVLVEGKVQPVNVYTKNDGTAGASLEVKADKVQFLSSVGENDGSHEDSDSARPSVQESDDIPF